MMATLCELKPGDWARVTGIQTMGNAHQRMMMMGLLPGTVLRLIHVAPLGDPIAVEFEGRRLCLRRAEAAGVLIERIVAPGSGLLPVEDSRPQLTSAALL